MTRGRPSPSLFGEPVRDVSLIATRSRMEPGWPLTICGVPQYGLPIFPIFLVIRMVLQIWFLTRKLTRKTRISCHVLTWLICLSSLTPLLMLSSLSPSSSSSSLSRKSLFLHRSPSFTITPRVLFLSLITPLTSVYYFTTAVVSAVSLTRERWRETSSFSHSLEKVSSWHFKLTKNLWHVKWIIVRE